MTAVDLFQRYQSVVTPLLRVGPIFGGLAILAWRVRETRVPISARAIVIPPVAMSTGFFMYLWPPMRTPWSWSLVAFAFGVTVLSWPLVRSSRLERRGELVYLRRSRAFLAILLGLLAVRLLLHDYIGHLISALQTASLFYLMAFGMIVRWRVGMYLQFRQFSDPASAAGGGATGPSRPPS